MTVTFKVFNQSVVDGENWYTVGCTKEVADWVRTNFKDQLYEHIDQQWAISYNRFDIPEKLYTLLILRWG